MMKYNVIMMMLVGFSYFAIQANIDTINNNPKGSIVIQSLVIKQVDDNDLEAIHKLLVHCGQKLHETMGLTNWYPFYSLQTYKEKVKNAQVYAVYSGDQLIATFNFTCTARDYYKSIAWENNTAQAIYVANVAVHPEYQGIHVGKWCLERIEEIALAMGFSTIRFDCAENHPWLCSFYEKAGYSRRGIVFYLHKLATWYVLKEIYKI